MSWVEKNRRINNRGEGDDYSGLESRYYRNLEMHIYNKIYVTDSNRIVSIFRKLKENISSWCKFSNDITIFNILLCTFVYS